MNEVSVELKKPARLHEETQRRSRSNFVLAYTHLSRQISALFFFFLIFFVLVVNCFCK